MKEQESITFDRFFDPNYVNLLWKRKRGFIMRESFKKLYGGKNYKLVQEYYELYYVALIKHCPDDKVKELLKEYKNDLENKFFLIIYKYMFAPGPKRNKIINEILIRRALEELFFFTDLTVSVFVGNTNDLTKMIKRVKEMSGKKLTDTNREKYMLVLNKQKELLQRHGSCHKSSLPAAICIVYGNKISPKELKSIAESIRYHKGKGNIE